MTDSERRNRGILSIAQEYVMGCRGSHDLPHTLLHDHRAWLIERADKIEADETADAYDLAVAELVRVAVTLSPPATHLGF